MAGRVGQVWGCQALTLHSLRDATVCAAALPWGPLLPRQCIQAAIAVFPVGWVTVCLPIFQSMGSLGLGTSKEDGMKSISEPGG